jgi:hypothetical protein
MLICTTNSTKLMGKTSDTIERDILSCDTEMLRKQNKPLNLKDFSICFNYQTPANAS